MKILVAIDESSISLRALREAKRLFPAGEFLVINVSRRPTPWMFAGDFGAVYPMEAMAELPPEGLDDDELAAITDKAGLGNAEVLAVEGDPAEAICGAADSHEVDVVVVGSHDKGALRRLVEPSVAQAVIHGTYRPVLVVSGEAPTA